MIIYTTDSLFAWNRLTDSPQLLCIREFFGLLADGPLLGALSEHRGRGRNDYPVSVLWFCALLQPLLRHTTMRGTLDELRRNRDLRELGGMQTAAEVPREWNMTRFIALLGTEPFQTRLHSVFDELVHRLGTAVPDLGENTAGDATHLSARRRKTTAAKKAGDEQPAPDGGCKEYTDDDGKVTHVLEWFGYKLHLLCDTRHEVTIAYKVTPASHADNEQIADLVSDGVANLPPKRIATLAYDKAADDVKVHQRLKHEGIKPLIENRALWKEEPERVLPGLPHNVVHNEAGTIYCYDMVPSTPVRHRMAYIGHEPSRGTLKYRCPARHANWQCPSEERCNAGKRYGMTVRVKQDVDLRRFPPIPRATKKFERLYKGRTAVERVNARLKIFWGTDDGNVAGGAPFFARIGMAMIVHVGLATLLARTPRKVTGAKTLGRTRLSPIAKALLRAASP
jgi:hypothetical protein